MLLIQIWPNYLNPMLSMSLSSTVEKSLKEGIPWFLEKIELEEFSLGSSPPSLAPKWASWSTVDSQKMMHLGFVWNTCDMSILLSAKLEKRLLSGANLAKRLLSGVKLARPTTSGTARIVINSLFIEGELQVLPILEGRALLCSFLDVPDVRIGVAFGRGTQSLPEREIPLVHWLVDLLTGKLTKGMVEPRRHCFSLPAVNLKKVVIAGKIVVKVVEANQISRSSVKGAPEEQSVADIRSFVEVELEQLTRRTDTKQGSSPRWNSSFNMDLHNSAGDIKFHLYECTPGSGEFHRLSSCEIRLMYCEDDSTIFWAIGNDSSAIAKQIQMCGQEVEMTVPFEGSTSWAITVRLVLKEWRFSDGSANFSAMTGRKFYVTVAEAQNLVRKDNSGQCNPYVELHYDKTIQKTKAIAYTDTPAWNQKFEFEEVRGGKNLTLKCFSEETFGDEQIGSARVNLEGLVDGLVKEVWIPLEKVASGDVKLLIESVWVDNNDGSKGNGWIELVLIEGKNLDAANLRGTSSNPYVKVQYGDIQKTTEVVYKTLNPEWHQTLKFKDDGSPLTLYVRSEDHFLDDIGEFVIEYQMLSPNQVHDMWIPLQEVENGEIHVQITRKIPELEGRNSVDSADSDLSSVRAHKITSEAMAGGE